jgi:hypothetical protein
MHQTPTSTGRRATSNQPPPSTGPGSVLEGLWVLLVANEGQLTTEDADGRVPMMAKAGDDAAYLLAFKNVFKARQFLTATDAAGAEPRMVVRGNRDEMLRIAKTAGAAGVLIDYDPTTGNYASATSF